MVFRKINDNVNKLSDTGAFDDILWSFLYLRYDDYILKLGGDQRSSDESEGRHIAVYDIKRKKWNKDAIELHKLYHHHIWAIIL